ncbi:MAG: NYN domain-containing protein [Burkholderiaceae bacterium]
MKSRATSSALVLGVREWHHHYGGHMLKRDSKEDRSVALYWDFENLHASLCEALQEGAYSKQDNRFKVQEPLVDVQAVVELAASFGPIAINRAYCNWQYFGRYRDALLQNAVELIQLFPPGGSAKNGADIKLCLDAMEDIGRFGHIGTVIIVGGDSDFMPVSQKIKAAGRTLIGVGARKTTNRHWAKSCHEFRYYESLVESPVEPAPASANAAQQLPAEPAAQADPAADIFKRAVRLLAQTQGDAWVNKASIWHMIKRLDSTFDPKEHGHANFGAMVKAFDALVEVKDDESDQVVRLR